MFIYLWLGLAAVAMLAALVLVFRCDRELDEMEKERRRQQRDFERQMRRLREKEELYDMMMR